MEKFRRVLTKFTAIAMVVMLIVNAEDFTCPPPGEEEVTAAETIHYSDVVVLGRVMERISEEGSDLYNVQMTVFCVYKGHNVPLVIDIAEAGDASDPCPEHQMEVGHQYMAYLYKHDHHLFSPAFPHHPDTYKDEMFVVCDLNITKPIGAVEAMREQGLEITCEDERSDYGGDYEEERCLSYTPEPGEARQREKKPRPNQPSKTEEKVEREGEPGSSANQPASVHLWFSLVLCAALWNLLH